jgi:hypothetical protein
MARERTIRLRAGLRAGSFDVRSWYDIEVGGEGLLVVASGRSYQARGRMFLDNWVSRRLWSLLTETGKFLSRLTSSSVMASPSPIKNFIVVGLGNLPHPRTKHR